jgi:hypothetical protein
VVKFENLGKSFTFQMAAQHSIKIVKTLLTCEIMRKTSVFQQSGLFLQLRMAMVRAMGLAARLSA